MAKTTSEQNKAIVLEAFDTLFKQTRLCSCRALLVAEVHPAQRSYPAGTRRAVRSGPSTPDSLRYENQVIVAEGDYVIAHGRFSGIGRPAAWIAADVVRFEDGLLAEHWDVLQDEATQKESVSGLPMFGKSSLHKVLVHKKRRTNMRAMRAVQF